MLTNYYREHGRAPCGFYVNQFMVVDGPVSDMNNPNNGWYYYNPSQKNVLFLGIGPNLVLSDRGASEAQEYWGTPQAIYTVVIPMFYLMWPSP